MFQYLETHPLLEVNFELASPLNKYFSPRLIGDLSLLAVETGVNKAVFDVSFLRLTETRLWSPGQTLIVGAKGTALAETMTDGSLLLDVEVESVLKLSGVGRSSSLREEEGDYRPPLTLPLPVRLNLRLSTVEEKLPAKGLPGQLSLVFNQGGVGDVSRIEGPLINASARLFKPELKVARVDASGTVRRVYFIPIKIVMLKQGDLVTAGISVDGRIGGARMIWTENCGIEIRPSFIGKPLIASSKILDELEGGGTVALETKVKELFSGTSGVPVGFVQRKFIPAGARSTGLGRDEMIVLTDQNPENRLLLAHELGHILNGTDFPASSGGSAWAGEENTIMHPTGDVGKEPKSIVGDIAKSNAFKGAFYEDFFI